MVGFPFPSSALMFIIISVACSELIIPVPVSEYLVQWIKGCFHCDRKIITFFRHKHKDLPAFCTKKRVRSDPTCLCAHYSCRAGCSYQDKNAAFVTDYTGLQIPFTDVLQISQRARFPDTLESRMNAIFFPG